MDEQDLSLPLLERLGTVDAAVQVIREGIIQGRIPPGTKLKVATLAKQLGTSNGSVREAIRVLSGEFLVEYRHNHGAVVREFSSTDMVNVYAAREAVERWAVARIIEDPSQFDLRETPGSA